MKYLKMLCLAAVAAATLTALVGVGTASATVLCKTNLTSGCASEDYPVGTEIHITQEPETTAVLETTSGTVLNTCTGGTTKGTIANTGGNSSTVSVTLTSLSWGTCTRTTHTITIGAFEFHHIAGSDNGTVTSIAAKTIKYDYRMAKITSAWKVKRRASGGR